MFNLVNIKRNLFDEAKAFVCAVICLNLFRLENLSVQDVEAFFYFLLFVCLGFSLWPCHINFETSLVMALHFGIYHTYV